MRFLLSDVRTGGRFRRVKISHPRDTLGRVELPRHAAGPALQHREASFNPIRNRRKGNSEKARELFPVQLEALRQSRTPQPEENNNHPIRG